ncbi:hypothetical protein [Pseudorhodoferax sp.]|uniref:hypothetical protein n=1 Tax=Pseudorhodoferax sp. TaxID=1993553 RepID=UPI0039E4905A
MSSFTPGWYAVAKQSNGSTSCLYFRSTEAYTARCTIDPNGRQILLWQDPQGINGTGRAGRWQPSYARLALATSQ